MAALAPCVVAALVIIPQAPASRPSASAGLLNPRQACALRRVEGCIELAFQEWRGKGGQQGGDDACQNAARIDGPRAIDLLQKACDGGNPLGCRCLGRLYVLGPSLSPSVRKALLFLERACGGGDPEACQLIGRLHVEGKVTGADPVKAAAFFRKACDGGHGGGCLDLGGMYRDGRGVPRDAGKALELQRRACEAGAPMGCALVEQAQAAADRARPGALAAHLKACAGGVARACSEVGRAYAGGDGVARNPDEAQRFFDRACDLGDGVACHDRGIVLVLGPRKDKPLGARYLEKGCQAGEPDSCNLLATLCLTGDGVPRDLKKGDQLLKRYQELKKLRDTAGP